ncbi:protein FAM117A-like isoform X3 [Myxocyprinus asiaticus]|uniref:protein FAM117A-like isoform X3 n=1 Tax=Myxocyprinus asiaticus TaxID=70543 RepID=UPI00222356DB|nr:protein FAM117A-like isoform X3 [Myxocyprinus asiaticus]
MSCRSGVARVGNQGLQPLRATVPFQLQNRTAPRCKDSKTAECKTKGRPPKPTLRRTLSLDTLVGPYLQGQWPKEPEGQPVNDKATQTPSSWIEETRGRRGGGGHKRSASWSSAEHLRETMPLIPLSRLAPRLRRSVEGLNLELEGVFVSETAKEHHKILDVPDGHRAPVPAQRYSSASQSDPSPAQLSPTHSPYTITDSDMVVCGPLCPLPSPPLCMSEPPSSSPRPNKTYVFQREPPEGCERVRVSEEAILPCHENAPLQPSCPDPNKVNFTPHGGSAFCPVSLLKPLLPSMDLLFRGLSVSPVTGCSAQGSAPCQTPGHAVGGYLSGTLPDSTTTS